MFFLSAKVQVSFAVILYGSNPLIIEKYRTSRSLFGIFGGRGWILLSAIEQSTGLFSRFLQKSEILFYRCFAEIGVLFVGSSPESY